jgi:glutathione S-transferase
MAAAHTLYIAKVCPYAHRSYIVAHELGVIGKEVTVEDVGLPTPAWYNKEVNPREMVPAIKLPNGATIPESQVVSQYLIDAFPDRAGDLFPKDPQERATVRLFMADFESFTGSVTSVFFEKSPEEVKKKWESAKEDIAFLEGALAKQGKGPFVLGERYTYADITIVPFLSRFPVVLKAFRGIDFFAEAPRLKALVDAAKQRESYKATAPSDEEIMEGFKKYA